MDSLLPTPREALAQDGRDQRMLRAEQDARWAPSEPEDDPRLVCACGEPKARTAATCADCSPFARFLEDDR